MAAAGFNSSPFILPNAFPEPGEVMANAIQNKRQDEQIKQQTAYRQQKDAEADQWKKLDLIQDLTDLSKHQTGSDVANAVGNQHASRILQKYTQAAPNMSPNELMAKVQQEMSGLITGMDAMKDELDLSDQELKLIKQNYPGINISQAAQMKRADILSRRMKGDQFVNPLEVQPSDIDFSNPEVLSEFVSDDSGLIKAITNPQGSEAESVLMGKQGDYTKFEGKLNYWKKPNYDRTQFNSEGFYSGKEIPTFVTKGTTLPSDVLPASNGKPFNIIDKDVLDQFTSDATQRLGLLAATKRRYKDYAKFSPQEKEYAQRNVLFDMVETLDPSQLHPTQNVRPQVTSIRNYSGGGTPKKDEGANWVKRATAAINEDNPVDIEDTFGELFKGNNAPYVGIKKNGDNFTVTYKDKQGYEATEDFNVKDRQLPNKLARLYQMIMGSDVKMEKGDYGTQDVPVMPKNDNPKGKGGWKPFSKKNTTITPTKDNPLGLDL